MLDAFIAGAFGLLVGSFVNVLVLRKGTGRSVLGTGGEGSACMSCNTPLRWYELLPVVSWLVLGGRCRTCKSAISIQYPLVEILVGTLFFILFNAPDISFAYQAVGCFGGALLIAIAVYDLRHTIIPDEWVYLFAFCGLLASSPLLASNVSVGLWLFSGPLVALPLFSLWFFSRGAWMGLGDPKLALGVGWFLGPLYGFQAIFLAFVIGAVISIVGLIVLPAVLRTMSFRGINKIGTAQSYTMKSEVPFGPFLAAAFFVVWVSLLYHMPISLVWTF